MRKSILWNILNFITAQIIILMYISRVLFKEQGIKNHNLIFSFSCSAFTFITFIFHIKSISNFYVRIINIIHLFQYKIYIQYKILYYLNIKIIEYYEVFPCIVLLKVIL